MEVSGMEPATSWLVVRHVDQSANGTGSDDNNSNDDDDNDNDNNNSG